MANFGARTQSGMGCLCTEVMQRPHGPVLALLPGLTLRITTKQLQKNLVSKSQLIASGGEDAEELEPSHSRW